MTTQKHERLVVGLSRAVLDHLEPVVILAALITIPLTIAEIDGQNGDSFFVADWAIWSVFALDYGLGLALAEDRRRYVKGAWLLLLIVVLSVPVLPAAFGAVRLARLARAFRIVRLVAFSTRALPALKATLGRRGLAYLVAVFLLLIAVAGAVMSIAEPQTVKGNLWDGMWWAIVTATTVGYGDISPVTPLGRLVAIALMLVGIGLTATLAASVAAYFVNEDKGGDIAEVVTRLDMLERLLIRLEAQGDSGNGDEAIAR